MRALLLNSSQILQIRAQTGDRQGFFQQSGRYPVSGAGGRAGQSVEAPLRIGRARNGEVLVPTASAGGWGHPYPVRSAKPPDLAWGRDVPDFQATVGRG